MKKFSLSLLVVLTTILFTGCGSSMYSYKVEPTPIKQGKSKYTIKSIDLKLEHGHGQNIDNKSFKSENELKNSFKEFISKELVAQNLLGDNNSLQIDIQINYKRTYNYGGNALNKPEFSYTVSIYTEDSKLLADFTIPKSTTIYSTFENMAVNAQIATFNWDAEDEPKDIELISKTLVKELSELGS